MALGKIISHKTVPASGNTCGEFQVQFAHANFGPYSHIFHRKNLYFHEDEGVRGSYFFPLKDSKFDNSEIFLETSDLAIGVGTRGSFSGEEKRFVEIISLKHEQKYRFYPDEVSLIYNTKQEVVIYYKKSGKHHKLTLDQKTLEKQSESSVELYAFFKLLYNATEKSYCRLYFHSNNSSAKNGYFEEQKIHEGDTEIPQSFESQEFILKDKQSNYLDVWESSLTGNIAYINPKDLG